MRSVVILAAGESTRMRSCINKILQPIGGLPILLHIIRDIPDNYQIIVVSNLKQEIENAIVDYKIDTQITFVPQKNALGTGNALLCALPFVIYDEIIVLCGDTPFVPRRTLEDYVSDSIYGFYTENTKQYGKLNTEGSSVKSIIEYGDCGYSELSLCNSGIMCIQRDVAQEFLQRVRMKNEQYRLTDLVELLGTFTYRLMHENEAFGVNTMRDLADAELIYQEFLRNKFLDSGVRMLDPATVHFSYDTRIGANVIIYPYVVIDRNVKISDATKVLSFSHIAGVEIGVECTIGPYARIRPETSIRDNSKVGNFVEVKNSILHSDVKVNHMSYIGDAEVGNKTNIGSGVVMCNFDGKKKNRAYIGENCFIGSNVNIVAPCEIGSDTVIGAGSTITKNVPKHSLTVERSSQRIIPKKN